MSEISRSLLLGIALYICTAWLRHIPSIPLLDVSQQDVLFQALPLLTAFQLWAAFKKKFTPIALGTAILGILVLEVYHYSSSYAFRHIVILVIGLYLVSSSLPRPQKKIGGQLFIFFLFIFAALQKINTNYLAGAEFIQGGGFVKFYEIWFPGSLPQVLEGLWKALPTLSIFIEIVIALGILFSPYIFSHLVALFLLILSFINPPVLFVYLLLLPVLININPSIDSAIPEGYLRKILSSAFFWMAVVYFSAKGFLKFGLNTLAPVLLFLISFHVYIFFKERSKYSQTETKQVRKDVVHFKVWAIPLVMIFIFVGSYLGLPSPYGFTMFSSRSPRVQRPMLTVSSLKACRYARNFWNISAVVDTAIVHVSPVDCQIIHPTISGLRNAAKNLCHRFPGVSLLITSPQNKTEEPILCSQ